MLEGEMYKEHTVSCVCFMVISLPGTDMGSVDHGTCVYKCVRLFSPLVCRMHVPYLQQLWLKLVPVWR